MVLGEFVTRDMARLNDCLVASNALLIVGCVIAAFYGSLREFEEARLHLKTLHRTAHLTPGPCSLPMPSSALLVEGIGRGVSVFSSAGGEQTSAEDLAVGFCGSASVHALLSYAMRNATILHSGAEAEDSFLGAICAVDSTLGDIRVRIDRAYEGAKPAFGRIAKGCSFEFDPFAATACQQSALVKSELLAGATQGGTTGEKLYRLLALATAGFFDRFVNSGRCFGVAEVTNATHLCATLLAETGVGFDASVSPPPPAAQETCGEHLSTPDGPSPPPAPAWLAGASSCEDGLVFGLVDLRRGFGVPDPVDPFEPDTTPAFWAIRPLYDWAFRIDDAVLTMDDRATRLRLYAAYRLAAVTAKTMVSNSVVGFVFGFASISTVVTVLSRVLRLSRPSLLVQPPMRSVLPIAFLFGVLSWAWQIWVDPPWHPSPFYVSGDCGASGYESSAPFPTSDGTNRRERFWLPWIVLATAAWAVFYTTSLRVFGVRAQLSRERRYLSPRTGTPLLMTFISLAQLVFLVLNAADSGSSWFDDAVKKLPVAELPVARLEDFENDLYLAAISALLLGFAVGSATQRWAAAKTGLLGRVPWMAAIGVSLWVPFFLQTVTYAAANDRADSSSSRKLYVGIGLALSIANSVVAFLLARALFGVPVPVDKTATIATVQEAGRPPPVSRVRSSFAASAPESLPLLGM